MREKVEPVRDEAKPSRPVEVEAKRGVAEMKRDSKCVAFILHYTYESRRNLLHRDDSDSQPLDRGRSRGGTRGGKQGVLSSDSAGLGHLNNDSFPNLDKEIEACDGSEALTQSLLGDLIKKPKLTEKLLSKPPFRFLFDIFTEVVQATGFSRGLYTVEEQDSSNVQEKEAKVLYLEKMIKLIGIHLNTVIEARPVKIVAGLEAQNTNVLLQLLAVAARHRPDSSKSVMLALEQLNVPVDAAAVSRAAPAGKSEDKSEIVEEPRTSEPVRESRARVQEDARAEEKPKAVQRPRDVDDDIKRDAEPEATDGSAGAGGEVRRSMRPTTALRRPPKVAASAKEVSAQETVVAAKKTQGLIVDGQTDDDEEIAEVDDTDRLVDEFKADAKGVDMGDPQSKLVKDILSRQAEQEASRAGKISDAESKIDPADDGKSTNSGIRLGRLRKTGADKKGGATTIGPGDIEKLRATVQVLVQHTGPLGSCMDFIQEDVGVMTSELRRWEEDCVKYETRLEEEKLKTQALLKPLNMELLEMTEQVNEQQERISSLKACIARKEEMILLNLKQVVSSSY